MRSCIISTYIIGDVQGCYHDLQSLLELIDYNPDRDRLGFVGDLVNRGPNSLETLRFVKSLKDPLVVLGNHDVYLVLEAYEHVQRLKSNTFDDVLNAPDKIELIEWVRHLPFVIEAEFGLMVHAGIPPQWSVAQAKALADELHAQFSADKNSPFLSHIEGKKPRQWSDDLQGYDRLRYIMNAFTRMRFCSEEGKLDLKSKYKESYNPEKYKPWYHWWHQETPIFFGHWAAINGMCPVDDVYALDTGCVYGQALTAIRIEDKRIFSYNIK
ncbi:MAG: hypothetical protein COB66_08840 [Coxiella sp. (in: Bacteria)]|nr:MAG: hypothetical protein COB66_08840 [Coxiella sp. (in: g-proteobacteria)]